VRKPGQLNSGEVYENQSSIIVVGSLRGRLLGRLAILLALLLMISSLSAYFNGRQVADTAYDRTLLASARTIAAGLSASDGTLRADVPYIALDTFAYDSAGRIYYQVLDIQGRLTSGYEDLPPPPANTPLTRDYPALARFYDSQYRGQSVRVVSLLQPVSEPGMTGMAEIRVAETEQARESMARSLLADTLLRLFLLAVGALIMVWWVVSVALRPLERLRAAVEERQADDLRSLPRVTIQRELFPLVNALNQFTVRLRTLFERQAQFIADAAHELRTPLAALKARLELGLREQEPDQWRTTLVEAQKNTDRLAHLANQLLSLARIESGAQAIAEGGAEYIELGSLARDLGVALAPLAYKRGVALELEAEAAVWVKGEPTLLNELLSNLIDNALAHTPEHGTVIIKVLTPCILEVEDDGPGIPAEARAQVFERFHRLDPQRGGAGLGLAIVGEICRAHQATITLHDGTAGGLRVRVVFPKERMAEEG
jgi:two-component system sensor histidine kinase TctE